jgi:fluoride exporter
VFAVRPHVTLAAGVLLTAVGGAVGAVARYGLQQAFPSHGTDFPWTTFAINVVGSGLLALLGATPAVRSRPELPVLLGTGVLGGFTTMSAASVDTFRLLDDGAVATGLAYGLGTLLVALALVALISRLDPIGESAFEAEEGDR